MSDLPSPACSGARLVRFGTFALDRERRLLLNGDEEVHLSPKAYELLDTFLASGSRALSKADLHARLWPDTFVSDANLASLVAELRAALGDHGREGRYIRTVHGFGYTFAVETAAVAGKNEPAQAGPVQWLVVGDRQLPLVEGEQIVGRDAGANLVIDSLSVSRQHARIAVAGSLVTLEDLASKNGTWKRGHRVEGLAPLEDGDELRFGSIEAVFRTLLDPAGTRTDVD